MTQENKIIREKITISLEYFDELLDKAYMLHCLEAVGVKMWEKFPIAKELYLAEV